MNKIFKFVGVGITVTLIDYLVYSFVMMVLFGGNTDLVWLGSIISGIVGTIAAYILHSNITWRGRDPGKYGVLKFFGWNVLLVAAIRPLLTLFFGLLDGLYEFAFMVTDGIGIPFTFEFVESTGIYVLMTVVIMVLNFLFYDRVVFGEVKHKDNGKKKVNVDSVRKSGEEKQSQKETKKRTNK